MKLRKVFNPAKRPWVNMDGAATDEIISIVDECPTAALTWKFNDELTEEEAQQSLNKTNNEERVPILSPGAEITIVENGPAIIRGNFKIITTEGKEINTTKQAALCRCGGSGNQPFCDGSHLINKYKG